MKMHKIIRIATVPATFGLLRNQLKFVSENNFEVIAVSSSGDRLQRVEDDEKVKTVGVDMTRTISPTKDIHGLWQLYKLLKKEKPDIVHTHTPKAGTLGVIAAKMAGVPYRLHTIAGLPLLESKGAKRRLLNLVEKITYSCATHLYPNSIGLKKIIIENKLTSTNKLKVIANGSSNGIDTSFFDPDTISEEKKQNLRKELNIRANDFIFLYVGRVVSHKGINELVQAFIMLKNNNLASLKDSAMHLVLVGLYEKNLDPLLPEIEQLIQDDPYIHEVGFKRNVIDYFAIADVLTFPSYREGFPNVVMQAASMKLNCIVSDINGCNEVITDGNNGWVVPIKNIEKLQFRMQWCIQNKQESKSMGLKSREIMQRDFERTFVHKEILKEYQRLLFNLESSDSL